MKAIINQKNLKYMTDCMTGRRIVYIVPGMNTPPKHKPFLEVAKLFRSNGIKPILININWKSSMNGYITQFIKKYNVTKKDGDKVYLFGFSAGAWIVLMAAIKLVPYMTILCSPSPYFKEDIKYWRRKWIREIGEEKFVSFNNYKFKSAMRKFRSKMIVFIGDKEYDFMLRRAKAIHKSIDNSRLVVVKSGEHDIGKKEYIRALWENLTQDNLF